MTDQPKRTKYTFSIDRNVLALLICIMAGAVMCTGHDGWGWLIFIAFLVVLAA
ncbi:hypothetical protein [Labrys sp. WJW]|uniref:hypothetical protein n=1 Tax=Labrys sp. WJW TaxID=1737983 RepID=UPI0012EAA825|nr:hypothetical protein [Labrys sp. WJW]